jgi:hypothetical protein
MLQMHANSVLRSYLHEQRMRKEGSIELHNVELMR